MDYIDFTQLGGYRLEQPTFAKMQAAYYDILAAMVGHFDITNPGNYIISGCKIVGADITPGILYMDGNLCFFAGAVGTLATQIKKQETLEQLEFQNFTTPPVFRSYDAIVDATGVALSTFITIQSPNNYLRKGEINITFDGADFEDTFSENITFPALPNSNYHVIGSFEHVSGDTGGGIAWKINLKTSSSFVVNCDTNQVITSGVAKFKWKIIED